MWAEGPSANPELWVEAGVSGLRVPAQTLTSGCCWDPVQPVQLWPAAAFPDLFTSLVCWVLYPTVAGCEHYSFLKHCTPSLLPLLPRDDPAVCFPEKNDEATLCQAPSSMFAKLNLPGMDGGIHFLIVSDREPGNGGACL